MGKLVISSSATLDGVVQDPDGEEGSDFGGWFHRSVDPEDLDAWSTRETAELLAADAVLLGRRTSEWFAARMRPNDGAETRVSPEWATRMTTIPKYVVTSTLADPHWPNATLLTGDAAQQIATLKQTVDGEILIYGSYHLIQTLLTHNLLDELRLVVFPAVAGTGHRLFTTPTTPHLLTTQKLGTNLVFTTYKLTHN
ncbi:dihydrofolate reductase family protein [Kribbella sp. GL6]|uniref:dihydrofolate reductase family protein n=1 Tax=Kribbella sp. GL6 TaxID=3419765 RepID=UPI003CFD382D